MVNIVHGLNVPFVGSHIKIHREEVDTKGQGSVLGPTPCHVSSFKILSQASAHMFGDGRRRATNKQYEMRCIRPSIADQSNLHDLHQKGIKC